MSQELYDEYQEVQGKINDLDRKRAQLQTRLDEIENGLKKLSKDKSRSIGVNVLRDNFADLMDINSWNFNDDVYSHSIGPVSLRVKCQNNFYDAEIKSAGVTLIQISRSGLESRFGYRATKKPINRSRALAWQAWPDLVAAAAKYDVNISKISLPSDESFKELIKRENNLDKKEALQDQRSACKKVRNRIERIQRAKDCKAELISFKAELKNAVDPNFGWSSLPQDYRCGSLKVHVEVNKGWSTCLNLYVYNAQGDKVINCTGFEAKGWRSIKKSQFIEALDNQMRKWYERTTGEKL